MRSSLIGAVALAALYVHFPAAGPTAQNGGQQISAEGNLGIGPGSSAGPASVVQLSVPSPSRADPAADQNVLHSVSGARGAVVVAGSWTLGPTGESVLDLSFRGRREYAGFLTVRADGTTPVSCGAVVFTDAGESLSYSLPRGLAEAVESLHFVVHLAKMG